MSRRPSIAATLKADLPASVVVFFVAIPLCLGIALASGAPLISGLIAGMVGGVVVGTLSGSPLGVSGPAAGLAVIVLTAIQQLGAFDIFLAAVVLAGVIQLILGFIKAGIVAYYFPSSVIRGMLAGIGVVIFLKQIPHAFGYDQDPEGDFAFRQLDGETTFSTLVSMLERISPGPLIIATLALVVLILWETRWIKGRKILSLVPGPLIVVLSGALLGVLFRSSESFALSSDQLVGVPIVDGVDGIVGMLTFPDFTALTNSTVYTTAVILAVVASLETLLCVEATDKLDPQKRVTPTNRELKAQGVGNVVSGLLGGLPLTQVIVRSSANIQAGGRTKLSAVIHGFLLMISVFALPTVLNLIPLAALAAVLLVVGYKLAKPSLFAKMFREGPSQSIPFIVTVGGIVFIDLLIGLALGLAAAVLGLLFENYRLPFRMNSQSGDAKHFRITLAQHVTFLNKANIVSALTAIPDGSTVEIDASESTFVHADVVEIVDDFVAGAEARDIEVHVEGLDHQQKGHPSSGIDVSARPLTDPGDQ